MAYIRWFFAAALVLAIGFFGIGLYIGPLSGDLTRVASLSERDFGWRVDQPVVKVLANSAAIPPSVIVLGDSFSESNVWQSVASQDSGLAFLTFDWNAYRQPSCLEPWIRSLSSFHPTTKVVILQTVERELLERFNSTKPCARTAPLEPRVASAGETATRPAPDLISAIPDPIYAVRALWGTVRRFDATTLVDDAVVAPLVRSDLFSHRRSDLMLYYRFDDAKGDWRLDRMQSVARTLAALTDVAATQGIDLLVLVIPDKSTAYARFLRQPQFASAPPDAWGELAALGVPQVRVRETVMDAAAAGVDTYLPNDTHFSTRGYVLLGHAVSARLAESAAPRGR